MDESDVNVSEGGAAAMRPQSVAGNWLQMLSRWLGEEAEMIKKDKQNGRWEVVYQTFGLMDAQVIVGRLHAEGIPARAWQEGAGKALGLTVGKLGMAHIEVPAEFVKRAEEIIQTDYSDELPFEDDDVIDSD